ncbi:MAG: DUF503 domain-containing protein [bacterium]
MRIGTLTLEISLPGCDTLKEKRHRLKGVIERVRSKFNVSASEIGYQDMRQSALVAVAMVSDTGPIIEKVFLKVEEFFENGDGLRVDASKIEWC